VSRRKWINLCNKEASSPRKQELRAAAQTLGR
jgi:hypothetical protein